MQQSKLNTPRVHDYAFESIDKIGSKADEYSEQVKENKKRDKTKAMLRNEDKANALYITESEAVMELLKKNLADKAEIHEIDGKKHVHIWFDNWSFYLPIQARENHPDLFPPLTNNGEIQKLDDFDSASGQQSNNSTLKDSLLLLENRFGLNANDYLHHRYVGSYFTGWNYLGQ